MKGNKQFKNKLNIIGSVHSVNKEYINKRRQPVNQVLINNILNPTTFLVRYVLKIWGIESMLLSMAPNHPINSITTEESILFLQGMRIATL